MEHFRGNNSAFRAPENEPRWIGADKDGIGTAYSTGGRVWFTIGRGILTEAYYSTVDRPQLRDLKFLFSYGDGLFLEEKLDLNCEVEWQLAAGDDCRRLLHAMERFSNGTCLLPEQVWDEADLPAAQLRCGGPTGSANPLLWAHREYALPLRSCHDGKVVDLMPEVVARYQSGKILHKVEFWLPKHPITQARMGHTLHICSPEAFRLRWLVDSWNTWKDSDSQATDVGGEYFDLAPADFQSEVEFTFFWTRRGQWAGQNHLVQVQ